MYDYGFFSYESKDDFLDRSREFWNPDKTTSGRTPASTW